MTRENAREISTSFFHGYMGERPGARFGVKCDGARGTRGTRADIRPPTSGRAVYVLTLAKRVLENAPRRDFGESDPAGPRDRVSSARRVASSFASPLLSL